MKIENLGNTIKFATYSSRMVNDPAGIAEELRQSAKDAGIKFDTIVGRGSSGMLIVPIVARILRKKWFIVRKDEEVKSSHDSSCKWMGELGKRWIFLDDFCSSGETFRKVRDGVKDAVKEATASYQSFGYPPDGSSGPMGWHTYTPAAFETELVGYFEYESRNDNGRTLIPWDEEATPGYDDRYWSDTPRGIAAKAEREAMQAAEDAAKGERLQAEAEAEADRLAAAAIEGAVYTVPAVQTYSNVIADCGPDCIVCSDSMKSAVEDSKIAIRSWGTTEPITSRYALVMPTYTNYTNPSNSMIVRSI